MKRKNPTERGRGFAAWARKMRVASVVFLRAQGVAVKFWLLRIAITVTSEVGMKCSDWKDSLQARIDALGGAE